ncbi:hypothetical protein [Providencia sneebia]|uniref:Uncharacterized protein n=1 Tax=Providencia sneebia DSM 19967 TaxID=1141660 RepID=K8W4P3_9GAMM|nr:hypothetical protein [Providencia sneebia]EKT55479.1 hypothetical protein OO7_10864 [Providencia sneebia DSM 19967]EKT55535.1 hypothetical protein OO7_11144 [Providencia sneebia DSM 19967]
MSHIPLDSLPLLRRIEALESALNITLASLSVLTPDIRDCVIANLDEYASTHQDYGIKKAHKELSDKIKNLKIERI